MRSSEPPFEAFFLSDVHLRSLDEPHAALLVDFLDRLLGRDETTHLFLVGDIFDLWIADRPYFRRKFAPIVRRLQGLAARGVAVHYFEGNHDLLLGRFWTRSGVRPHTAPYTFRLGGLRIRVEHGDQVDPADRGYRFLRWFLHTPPLRFLAHGLPGSLVGTIGERASRTSRQYTSERKTITERRARERFRRHAWRVIHREPLDLIIAGHLHVRDDSVIRCGDRAVRAVNLGSWQNGPAAFRVTDREQAFLSLSATSLASPQAR